jgi:cytochrome c oxidase subunit IV
MSEKIVPVRTYVATFVALLIFTVLTTWIATIDLHQWNTVVALLIAGIKMSLVALFFMHLRWGPALDRLVAIAALFWWGILITITLADVISRNWTPQPLPWSILVLPFLG